MIDIGEKPILWHILKIYAHFGYRDFVVCLGYKGYFIKEYFAHYLLHESNVTFDFADNHEAITYDQTVVEPWRVSLVDTGLNTMTAGRVRRIRPYIGDEPFMLTYGTKGRSRHRRVGRSTAARKAGHGHRHPADGAFRSPPDG
jgi:glucose-1-phosphate cytidylyltransferase